MNILGISGLYHDSAAALVSDGELVFASHEERYSRIKQDRNFPVRAIGRVLENSGLSLKNIDRIAWFEDPSLKFQRSLQIVRDNWPKNSGYSAFKQLLATPYINHEYVKSLLKNELNWSKDLDFVKHHESHMASALFAKKGKGRTLVFTVDGIGEFETATAYLFDYSKTHLAPQKVWSLEYPNSIGLFYSAVTQYLGFEVNEGEYKVMGLAPYGKPIFFDNLVNLATNQKSKPDKPIFNKRLINWGHEKLAYGENLSKIFNRDFPPTKFDDMADIAASTQKYLEYQLISVLDVLIKKHRPERLRMAGGVALNCTANAAISRKFGIAIDTQPAAGDAGCAAGAALSIAYKLDDLDFSRMPENYPTLIGSLVGTETELENFYSRVKNVNGLEISDVSIQNIANLLSIGKVIAIAKGRAEYGPRALGNRAILASPLNAKMKEHLNAAIKFREEFRPFAPVVCEDDYDEYFERLPGSNAKHMLYTVKSKHPELIPAVTHVDGTSRVQELSYEFNPFLFDILKNFGKITGVPVLTLTSFNLKGEPIVQSADDALNTFLSSGIDGMVIESRFIYKV
jgi:carbamoyltransferase